jgi:alpha-mannosidase
MHVTLAKVTRRTEELAGLRYAESLPLGPLYAQRLDASGAPDGPELVLVEGDRWGGRDEVYLLRFEVAIPERSRDMLIALQLHFSGLDREGRIQEGLLFVDGHPFHAIDRFHREVLLPPEMAQRASLPITLRLWTGLHSGLNVAEQLRLAVLDPEAGRLYARMRLALDALETLPEDSYVYTALLSALDAACLELDFREAPSPRFSASCRAAWETLNTHWQELSTSVAGSAPCRPHVTAVGHAHIDLAWLWRLRHTRMKAANTFSTALYHMDRYPQFRFVQSQPQLYQFVKEDHPDLYERIKEKAATGQWEPEGAMWVEADTNITGAESLVRQFLVGKRFFREEFGHNCRVLWLPDVFGYSAALPQIMKGAGVDYFITAKISWNETNRFPYDTFWWEGLDGTAVLTQYLTTPTVFPGEFSYTYNADLSPTSVANTWKVYQQKGLNPDLLLAFGFGDGGGGPTRQQVEALEPLAEPISEALPAVSPGRVEDYMERLELRLREAPDVPRWVGELYLEYHRGTYTSQARMKRANRTAERDLHNAEWLASMALYLCGQAYPSEELDGAWKLTLLNHFHDILPGSSIAEVYQDALKQLAQVSQTADRLSQDALDALGRHIDASPGSLLVFNSTSWKRDGLVEVDAALAESLLLPSQSLSGSRALVAVSAVPALGYRAYEPSPAPSITRAINGAARPASSSGGPLLASPTLLENRYYRIELDEHGQITRLLDKEGHGGKGREVLRPGDRANVFQLFEDRPLNWDAWDINEFYDQKSWALDHLTGVEVIETGPLRAGLQLEWSYLDRTTVNQRIYVYAHSRRIDFATEVYWRERRTLLKVAFPVDVHNGRATAEVQFGNIERPTHRNTSWDRARFETCAHKWFDLSESDYGVALLNDCKYGYDVHGRTLRLTLLKGAVDPDPTADLGLHQFTYSLLPHNGGWYEGGVGREAYDLNYPLLAQVRLQERGEWTLPPSMGLVEATPANVVVETVKKAEEAEALVVRVYECANRRGPFQLRLPFPASRVEETNLLEEQPQPAALSADRRTVHGTIQPYQIKTFAIYPAS